MVKTIVASLVFVMESLIDVVYFEIDNLGHLFRPSILKRRELISEATFPWSCLIGRQCTYEVWKYLWRIWKVLSSCYLVARQQTFNHYAQNALEDEMEIMFKCLTCPL